MPTLDELGAAVKKKYPQYADMPDAEVGKLVKKKYPEQYKDYEGRTPMLRPKEKKDIVREATSDVLGTMLPENRPEGWDAQAGMIAATAIPGFGQLGWLARGAIVAGGGVVGSLYEDIKNVILGDRPKKSAEQIALRAGISGALGFASEAVPIGIAKAGAGIRNLGFGHPISQEVKDVSRYATEKGFEVNVADYRQGLIGTVKQFHESSAFGRASGRQHRARYLARLSEVADNTLDAISSSPGEVEAGKLVHKGLEKADEAFRSFDRAHFESIMSQAGDEPVKLGPEKFTEVSELAKTIKDLAKEVPGIDPQVKTVNDLIRIFKAKTVSKGGGRYSEEDVATMLQNMVDRGKMYPDDPIVQRGAEIAGELYDPAEKKAKEITPRAAHRLQSILGQMAYHSKSRAMKKVALEAQGMVRDSLMDTLGPSLGQEYMDAIAYSAEGRALFDGKIITTLMEKNPEALVNSVKLGTATQPGDYTEIATIKEALLKYGNNYPAWDLFKRRLLEKEVRASGAVTTGEAGIAPMEDLLTGIKNTGENLRYNKEIIRDFFSDPADKAAIDGFKKMSEMIRLQETPLTPPRATHYGMYYALHLAALAGGGLAFSSGHPVGGLALGLGAVALSPAVVTRIMYTPAAQRILLRTMDEIYARRARGLVPNGAQIDSLIRAFVLGVTKGKEKPDV